jgi:hypothetical protein
VRFGRSLALPRQRSAYGFYRFRVVGASESLDCDAAFAERHSTVPLGKEDHRGVVRTKLVKTPCRKKLGVPLGKRGTNVETSGVGVDALDGILWTEPVRAACI